jgi:hypothetical protein
MIIVISIKIFEKSGKILEKKSTSKKMLRPLSSSLFYNLEVQASAHDFCNFNKIFWKNLEKIWKNLEKFRKKKVNVQKNVASPIVITFLQP